ncbi:MAG: DUF1015 domain-containing protein, partial [Acidimicrobiales bacterium]
SATALTEAMATNSGLGLVTAAGGFLLLPRPELVELSEDGIDSVLVAVALDDLGVVDVGYQHGAGAALEAVKSGRAQAAVLLRPVSVEQIAATAREGRRMPPKSTFFHPKPRTGMVFRELEPS